MSGASTASPGARTAAIALAVELDADDADSLAAAAGDWMCDAMEGDPSTPLGIQQDDATTMGGRDLSPGRGRVTLYLAPAGEEEATSRLRALVDTLSPLAAIARAEIADEDWNATWKAHFRAIDLGRRLRIEPPWDRHAAGERLVLVIDPGMAFGTGSHETTRMATELLELHADLLLEAGADLGRVSLLDVGTGSGLLAIAAAALGFGHVDGVDNDAVAIASARDNLRHNQMADRIALSVAERPQELEARTYGVVVANIISSVLLALRQDLLDRLADDGLLLLSGVLGREREAFLPAMLGQELELVTERDLGEWKGFAMRRRQD